MPSRESIIRHRVAPLTAVTAFLTLGAGLAHAQRVIPQPVTDSSAQASPLAPTPKAPVADASAQASPITPERSGSSVVLVPHTAIPVALEESIDSGKLKQGQEVKARLSAPIAVHGGPTLPSGTPVALTVIETVAAGRMMAEGEFSLQVLRVGKIGVYTDTLVFDGKPGHQDLPDSAPELGTDAGLPSGAPLMFHVQAPPTAADQPPQDRDNGPGSVDGVAAGDPPPPTALKSTYNTGNVAGAGSGNTPGQQQRAVSPADTTTNQQTQHLGQTSVAPNQPQSPGQTSPSATQPR